MGVKYNLAESHICKLTLLEGATCIRAVFLSDKMRARTRHPAEPQPGKVRLLKFTYMSSNLVFKNCSHKHL